MNPAVQGDRGRLCYNFAIMMPQAFNPAFGTIIDSALLAPHLDDPDWAVIDCRFDLFEPEAGERQYRESHIPGAVFADLDRDLSAPKSPDGRGGRHPMPSPAAMSQLFTRLGIDRETQVVAYDGQSGHYAARLWWMLRYMGHDAVAVLDGGWPSWVDADLPVRSGWETRPPRQFAGAPLESRLVVQEAVAASRLLVDARMPERYRGEVEPLDPVAGHIPGAVNLPYTSNWTKDGRWRSQEALLAAFLELLGDTPPEEAAFYCGSGVSACVNLLGMAHAGLPIGRLYAGSWSEWSRLGLPVETGEP